MQLSQMHGREGLNVQPVQKKKLSYFNQTQHGNESMFLSFY